LAATIIFYIDDVLPPAATVDHTAAVFRAYEYFKAVVGSGFNLGCSKTAMMGIIFSMRSNLTGAVVTYYGTAVPTVDQYSYVGIILDCACAVEPYLKISVAKSWDTFNGLQMATDHHGFTASLLAAIIPASLNQNASSSCIPPNITYKAKTGHQLRRQR